MPHGAKSYLAAALALAPAGERLVWIARDAEIGDRVAEELGAWLGDVDAVAVLEPRTALAYERSELIADETAARVAALAVVAERPGADPRRRASRPSSSTRSTRPTCRPPRASSGSGARVHQDALLRELFDLGYVPVSEVAGRGESARRGGIVDVFPPSMPLPIRIEFFGDEIDSLRSFDPTDQRTVGTLESAVLLPASEFLLPAGGAAAIRDRLGRAAARLPERLAADLERFDAPALDAAHPADPEPRPAGRWRSVTRPRCGPPTSPRRPASTTSRPGTLLLLDEPGDIAEAAGFLWRQADERRAELVEAGELPKDWPSTYLPPRDWKGRLVASRTLELTWESVPPEDVAMARGALSSGDPFGWREPVLPPGRAGRLAEAVEAWRADGARIVLASDQAPRLADLLGEAGHDVAVVGRVGEPPPPGAIALIERSLNGGFAGGPDGLAFVTDRELFGTVRIRRPEGAPAGRPARHPRAPDAGRPRRPHRPRRRPLRADAPARRRRRGPRLPRAVVRRRRPDLRPGRADRPGHPLLRRRAAGALQARRHGLAAGQAARPQGGRRPRRGAARAVRVAGRRARPRLRARHAVAVRDGGLVPVRGDHRPAARRRPRSRRTWS